MSDELSINLNDLTKEEVNNLVNPNGKEIVFDEMKQLYDCKKTENAHYLSSVRSVLVHQM